MSKARREIRRQYLESLGDHPSKAKFVKFYQEKKRHEHGDRDFPEWKKKKLVQFAGQVEFFNALMQSDPVAVNRHLNSEPPLLIQPCNEYGYTPMGVAVANRDCKMIETLLTSEQKLHFSERNKMIKILVEAERVPEAERNKMIETALNLHTLDEKKSEEKLKKEETLKILEAIKIEEQKTQFLTVKLKEKLEKLNVKEKLLKEKTIEHHNKLKIALKLHKKGFKKNEKEKIKILQNELLQLKETLQSLSERIQLLKSEIDENSEKLREYQKRYYPPYVKLKTHHDFHFYKKYDSSSLIEQICTPKGLTPLCLAVKKQDLEMITVLLRARADVQAPANRPHYSLKTPLHFAFLKEKRALRKALKNKEFEIAYKKALKNNEFQQSVKEKKDLAAIVKIDDPDVQEYVRSMRVVNLLRKNGADNYKKDNKKRRAVDLASDDLRDVICDLGIVEMNSELLDPSDITVRPVADQKNPEEDEKSPLGATDFSLDTPPQLVQSPQSGLSPSLSPSPAAETRSPNLSASSATQFHHQQSDIKRSDKGTPKVQSHDPKKNV